MTGSLEFFSVVAVLYMIECLVKVRADAAVYHTGWRRLYQSFSARLVVGNGNWAWVLLNPLRPDSPAYACTSAPYWLTSSRREARLNLKVIRHEVKRFRDATRMIRYLSVAITIVALILFPLAAAWIGLTNAVLGAGAISVLLSSWASGLFARVLREYEPSLAKMERWGILLHLALYPLAVTRCLNRFSLPLLSKYHPVVVAGALCGRDELESAALEELARLQELASRQPGETREGKLLKKCAAHHLAALLDFLKRVQIDVAGLQQEPERADDNCRSYCPACRVQYTVVREDCADCGVALRPFHAIGV